MFCVGLSGMSLSDLFVFNPFEHLDLYLSKRWWEGSQWQDFSRVFHILGMQMMMHFNMNSSLICFLFLTFGQQNVMKYRKMHPGHNVICIVPPNNNPNLKGFQWYKTRKLCHVIAVCFPLFMVSLSFASCMYMQCLLSGTEQYAWHLICLIPQELPNCFLPKPRAKIRVYLEALCYCISKYNLTELLA